MTNPLDEKITDNLQVLNFTDVASVSDVIDEGIAKPDRGTYACCCCSGCAAFVIDKLPK